MLRRIAIRVANSGDIESALILVQLIKNLDNPDHKYVGLREIAILQAKNGDIEGVLKTVQLIKEDWAWKSMALKKIAMEQANSGYKEGAIKTALLIKGQSLRDKALKAIEEFR